MSRATLSPLLNAVIAVVETASGVPVGDGVAPDCDAPYMIVSAVSMRPYTGPFGDMEADSDDRIQVSGIGTTRAQADSMRDAVRGALTVSALDAEFDEQPKAQGTLRVGNTPQDGDTFTVDGKVYTLQSTLTDVDGHIYFSSWPTAKNNITSAFDLSGTAGVDYAVSMTAHPTVDMGVFVGAGDAILTAKTAGTAGNLIDTTETFFSASSFFYAPTLSTTTLRRTLKVFLDMSPVTRREDRGLPNPIFTAIDQYMIETTPT